MTDTRMPCCLLYSFKSLQQCNWCKHYQRHSKDYQNNDTITHAACQMLQSQETCDPCK